jgi:hypothetical protein
MVASARAPQAYRTLSICLHACITPLRAAVARPKHLGLPLSSMITALLLSTPGLCRNFDGTTTLPTMPQLWQAVLPASHPELLWNASSWTPDAVVINLGTNDFTKGVPDEGCFRDAYLGVALPYSCKSHASAVLCCAALC